MIRFYLLSISDKDKCISGKNIYGLFTYDKKTKSSRKRGKKGLVENMKKVVKFGGSSLASAEQFRKVGEIIRSDKSRRYVVPSAPGKRYDGDTKVTDLLYQCYELAEQEKDFSRKSLRRLPRILSKRREKSTRRPAANI